MASDIVSDIQDSGQKQDRVRRSCWLCNDCEAEDADDAAAVLVGRMLGLGSRVACITVHYLVVSVQAGLGSRMRNRCTDHEGNNKECREQPPCQRSLG
ncbi:hypothetical protein [Pseudorhizobium banfieldiae]|uniref:hypothetical protein n=1 Tax=Pseudorhizobium banfieldiae TaxID=1125847 RepID=UPI0006990FAF|nr:hypothetical protein [Pseudorhizobium banfieldiae]